MKTLIAATPLAILLAPQFAFAQNLSFLTTLIAQIKNILKLVIPLLVTVAIIFFFVELIRYIRSENDAEKKKEALKGIFMSLLAIFIMLAFMGLISLLNNALGGNLVGQDITNQQLPQLVI